LEWQLPVGFKVESSSIVTRSMLVRALMFFKHRSAAAITHLSEYGIKQLSAQTCLIVNILPVINYGTE
jgi:hypothetical protein